MNLLKDFLSRADRFFGGSGYIGGDDEDDVYADPANVRPPATAKTQSEPNPFDDGEEPDAPPAPAPAKEPTPEPQPEPKPQPPAEEEEDLYAETAGASGDTQVDDAPQAFAGYALRWLRAYRTSEGNNTFLDQRDIESYYAVEHPEMSEDEIMGLIAADMSEGKLKIIAFALNYDGTPKKILPANHPASKMLLAEITGETNPAPQPEQPPAPAPAKEPTPEPKPEPEPQPEPKPQPPAEEEGDPPKETPAPAPAESASGSAVGVDLEKLTAGMSPEDKALFLRAYAEKMAEAAIRAAQPPAPEPPLQEEEAPAAPPPPVGRGMPPVERPKYDA